MEPANKHNLNSKTTLKNKTFHKKDTNIKPLFWPTQNIFLKL